MTERRRFVQRSAGDVRAAAASICDRLARQLYTPGSEPQAALAQAAMRIRRMPVAGMLKPRKRKGLIR